MVVSVNIRAPAALTFVASVTSALASMAVIFCLSEDDISPATDAVATAVLASVTSASGNVNTLVVDVVMLTASNLTFLEVSAGSTITKFSSLILIGSLCVSALNVKEILSTSSPPK